MALTGRTFLSSRKLDLHTLHCEKRGLMQVSGVLVLLLHCAVRACAVTTAANSYEATCLRNEPSLTSTLADFLI